MTPLIIKVTHRKPYGRNTYDPICRLGKLLLAFADRKAFIDSDIELMKQWGIQIKATEEKK